MCRLRTNFARLGDPLQGLHKGKQANLASLVGNAPLSVAGATTSPKGKHVTGFSGRLAPLRIQFLCHPGEGSLLSAQLLNSKSTQGIAPLKPPPPGEVPKAEGVHFLAPKARLYGFFPARQGGCKGFIVPPLAEGKVVAKPPKGDRFSLARQGGMPVFPRAKARLYGFPSHQLPATSNPHALQACPCSPTGESPVVKVLFILAAKPSTFPSEPSAPFEPSEPSRPPGVSSSHMLKYNHQTKKGRKP